MIQGYLFVSKTLRPYERATRTMIPDRAGRPDVPHLVIPSLDSPARAGHDGSCGRTALNEVAITFASRITRARPTHAQAGSTVKQTHRADGFTGTEWVLLWPRLERSTMDIGRLAARIVI